MFARAAIVLFALPALALAQGLAVGCQTGNLTCCNQLVDSQDPLSGDLLGSLIPVIGDVTTVIGLGCDPVAVFGGAGTGCNEQTVCCENTAMEGAIGLGCVPLNVNT
ncbi:hypothetical protein H0H92_003707 [Tricholoma furcatifolium]|nr:hypothetical protein H0H92_003707 [Tricholoma furcatifolium]